MRDVFQLIEGTDYRLGKLARNRVNFYKEWHFEMDRYFESNYVLVRIGTAVEHSGVAVRFDAHNVSV